MDTVKFLSFGDFGGMRIFLGFTINYKSTADYNTMKSYNFSKHELG